MLAHFEIVLRIHLRGSDGGGINWLLGDKGLAHKAFVLRFILLDLSEVQIFLVHFWSRNVL